MNLLINALLGGFLLGLACGVTYVMSMAGFQAWLAAIAILLSGSGGFFISKCFRADRVGEQPIKGKWISHIGDPWECSNCHADWSSEDAEYTPFYCPDCGAKNGK